MTIDGSIQPKTAARRLRTELREAREQAGLTQETVAARLGWSPSKIMRIERGAVSIGEKDLKRLTDLLDLTHAHKTRLLEYARAAKQRSWWHEFRDFLPYGFLEYIGHESEAAQIDLYNPLIIPGLCQTGDYARAVMPVGHNGPPDPDAYARLFNLRVARQRRVLQTPEGPLVRATIDEAALYRPVGGAGTMTDQLMWLAELARRPSIELRVLPLDAQIVGPALPFVVLKFAGGDPDVVYFEAESAQVAERSDSVERYIVHFDRLWERSLDARRTNHLLHHVAEQYRSGANARPWL